MGFCSSPDQKPFKRPYGGALDGIHMPPTVYPRIVSFNNVQSLLLSYPSVEAWVA